MIYANGNSASLGSNYEMYQQQHASPLNGYPPCTNAVLHDGNLVAQPLVTSVAPIGYVPQPSPALAASAPYRYANNSISSYPMAPQIGQVATVISAYPNEYDITQAGITSTTFDESLVKSIVNAYESAHQIYLTSEPDEPNLSIREKQENYLGMVGFNFSYPNLLHRSESNCRMAEIRK